MREILFIILLILLNLSASSQSKVHGSIIDLHHDLKLSIAQGLKYLDNTQRKETILGSSFKGEWPTYMCLERSFFYLGSKKDIDDSNCFSVASTHNSLANIYLAFPEYDIIPNMLDLSFEKIMTYKNGNKFNFWNLLSPNRKLKKDDIISEQGLVRRPTNYNLKSKYINNAANIAEDADDTALGYSAIALRGKYKKDSSFTKSSISPIFEEYRDVNRNNRHWYNYINGNDHETGAYLTWLTTEYQFKNWNIIKVIGHNATFFLPFSECYPHAYKPYLPYGSNDLDGVVNANILSTLAFFDELNSEGVEQAIKFIEKKSKREKYDKVGIYYPNRYHFPYSVCKAYYNGVDKLESSIDYLSCYLKDKQNEDGSWSAKRSLNRKDKLQSTAYALSSLIYVGRYEELGTIKPIENAIDYLFRNSINNEQGTHWEGGVFFSGGTVIRNILTWKSDAYTTGIILEAFAHYRKHLEEKNSDLVNL